MSVIIENNNTTTSFDMSEYSKIGNWADLMNAHDMETPQKEQKKIDQKKKEKNSKRAAAKKEKEAKMWEKVGKTKTKKPKVSPMPHKQFKMEPKGFKNSTLILKNLPFDETYIHELMEIFEHHGELQFVNVLRNEDQSCKGIAFIRFKKPEQAEKALKSLPDFWYNNRKVFVDYANDRRL